MTSSDNLLLMDYLLGFANPEERHQLEQRLEREAALRTQMVDMQNIIVKFSPTASTVNPVLRARILSGLNPQTRFFGYAQRLSEQFDLSPERIRELLREVDRFPAEPWTESMIPGIFALHFNGGRQLPEAECGIVHMAPGTPFPVHTHKGDEWALVLQGESCDDKGVRFLPGDLCYQGPGDSHAFRSVGAVPLILAVFHHGFEIDGAT